ncbi:hypothetical protein C0J50_16108 [Silurus asotus]|uniref:Uncharacterized protein n=1 Tax=Silurus asotus TaxID=30991 RepID=A0AAD5AWW9_SILAS|nr:hypothetical protein C0J50_16108 [Silurus asotus]
MGAKLSRRKSDGAGAPSEQKCDDLEAETMAVEKTPQVDITPRDFTSQAAVSEEPKDALDKDMDTMENKMASVSVEDSTELVAVDLDPEAKNDSLTRLYPEASTKMEFSIPESSAEPALPLWEPLTAGTQGVPEAPECDAEAAFGDVEALPMKNEGSGEKGSEIKEMVSVNQEDP